MKEAEYIFLSNLMRLRSAINTLRNITPGGPYGIDDHTYKSVMKILSSMLDKVQEKELIDNE